MMADPAATLRRLRDGLERLGVARFAIPTDKEIRSVLDPELVHHGHEPEIERSYLTPPQLDLLDALTDGSALALDPVPPLSASARDLLAAYQGTATDAADLRRALSWLDELNALFSATLDSRSWKIGRALTGPVRRLLGGAKISAAERATGSWPRSGNGAGTARGSDREASQPASAAVGPRRL